MEKQQRMGWEPVSPTWRKNKNQIRVEDTDSHPTQENNKHSVRIRMQKKSWIRNDNNIKMIDPTERIHKKRAGSEKTIGLLGRYQESDQPAIKKPPSSDPD